MHIIEEFRNIINSEIGNLWDIIQGEIKEYFDIIDFANINYRKNYRKLNQLKEEFLDDPLSIPEIYPLLYEIKESNFNNFDIDSITKNYNHYEHGYYLRDTILPQLDPIVERVESFRIENFNKLIVDQIDQNIKKFIAYSFQDYGLIHYDSYLNVINGIAYHKDFYIILPNLLRCVFENLLYDIFQTALDKKHTDFIFLKSQGRARDFSQLIALINILKDKEFRPYHKNSINQSVIEVLKEIQKFGNLSVHQIIRQVDRDFTDKMKEKVNRILLALLVFFKTIQKKNLVINNIATIDKINKALGLTEKKKQKKLAGKREQESGILAWKLIIQEDIIQIDERAVVQSILPDIVDGNIIRINCGIEKNNWDNPKKTLEFVIDEVFDVEGYYNYKFAIFSLARISYAIYLGYLLTNQVKIRYSQYNRDLQAWKWIGAPIFGSGYSILGITGLFEKKKKKITETVIKISISAKILDDDIRELGLDINNKIELAVIKPSEDWLISKSQITDISKKFRYILANLREKLPNLNKIHLFYAGPTAGAIAIGRQINPRMTPIIQLYEYNRANSPRYQRSIILEENLYE